MRINQGQAEDLRNLIAEQIRNLQQEQIEALTSLKTRIPEWEDASPNDWDTFQRDYEDVADYETNDIIMGDESQDYEQGEELQEYYAESITEAIRDGNALAITFQQALNAMPEWEAASAKDWDTWFNTWGGTGVAMNTIDDWADTLGLNLSGRNG